MCRSGFTEEGEQAEIIEALQTALVKDFSSQIREPREAAFCGPSRGCSLRFLEYPRIPLDRNGVERGLRGVAVTIQRP